VASNVALFKVEIYSRSQNPAKPMNWWFNATDTEE
jgi:hypothetical protein